MRAAADARGTKGALLEAPAGGRRALRPVLVTGAQDHDLAGGVVEQQRDVVGIEPMVAVLGG
ncbi:MAG: hypothetical protein ACRDPA_13935, partial [Solirubrobacteraceae bacterium]